MIIDRDVLERKKQTFLTSWHPEAMWAHKCRIHPLLPNLWPIQMYIASLPLLWHLCNFWICISSMIARTLQVHSVVHDSTQFTQQPVYFMFVFSVFISIIASQVAMNSFVFGFYPFLAARWEGILLLTPISFCFCRDVSCSPAFILFTWLSLSSPFFSSF